MVEPLSILVTLSAIILVGVAGNWLFERTRVSDTLLMVAFGMLLSSHLATDTFDALTPLVGTLALIIILFDGGLQLKFRDLLESFGRATILSVVGFVLTILFLAVPGILVVGLSPAVAVLLGTILAGTSSIIVFGIVQRLKVQRMTKTILVVESAVTDVLVVVCALTIAEMMALSLTSAAGVSFIAQEIVVRFSVALVVGAVAGFTWLAMHGRITASPFEYVLTMAALFLLYAGVEVLNGSGPIAVLTFGIVLGNGSKVTSALQMQTASASRKVLTLQGEVAFFVRTFFFVYLGLLLDPAIFTGKFLLEAGALVAAIVLARYIAVALALRGDRKLEKDRGLVLTMLPRGLAAAVLASVPATQFGLIEAQGFLAYVFAVIVLTNLVATFGGMMSGRADAASAKAAGQPFTW